MAIPKRNRSTRKVAREGANPEAASKTEKATMFHIKVGLRPKRSASRPNINAPRGRAANVKNTASETFFTSTWNVLAISLNMNTMRKKSNASRVQPR
jgi:hypothetical protein